MSILFVNNAIFTDYGQITTHCIISMIVYPTIVKDMPRELIFWSINIY